MSLSWKNSVEKLHLITKHKPLKVDAKVNRHLRSISFFFLLSSSFVESREEMGTDKDTRDQWQQTVSNCVVFRFLYVCWSELWGHRRCNFGNKITVYRRSLRSPRWKRNVFHPLSPLSMDRNLILLEMNYPLFSIIAQIPLSMLLRYVGCPRRDIKRR